VGPLICEHLKLSKEYATKIAPTVRLNKGVLSPNSEERRLADWEVIAERTDKCQQEVIIALVGKYTGNPDAYASVVKALQHAAMEAGLKLKLTWVDSSSLEPNTQRVEPGKYAEAWEVLKKANGVLVPGGFGTRGIEGKIGTAGYCRANNIPYLGICVGLQTAIIEFARSQVGWEAANSTEFDEATPHPVVVFLPEASTTVMGGTMRLGSRATIIQDPDSMASKLYGGRPVIYERHRHRYEVSAACVPAMEAKGLRFVGQDDRRQRMELVELSGHPFFLACQFHPEFQSHPSQPGPLFLGLVLAAAGRLEKRLAADGGKLRVGAGFENSV